MTAVFLQVRLDSERLPNKALLRLRDKTVIEHAMESLCELEADVHAILTDRESAPALRGLATAAGFETYVGPKEDVLARYVGAVRHFGVDTIVRATGDNPLVSAPLAAMILEEHVRVAAAYSGYDGPPLGTGVEILDAVALATADREAVRRYDREHVSPYLYTHPEQFVVHRIDAPKIYHLPSARVTLDTPEDYALLQAVYRDLYDGGPIPVLDLIRWLRRNLDHRECRNSA